ncbi:UPF0114 domain-containing protein [Cucumis melo var. makuwa]|uniref:UPF0114 domain-containing protein n=1 Tax=Cucumis melo var. makuwa TaxID=1194695 RepID=A0A5A7VG09_CUCMM|nr:UPF0114 domain-containing protein [Cucumis melo var. makuwa]
MAATRFMQRVRPAAAVSSSSSSSSPSSMTNVRVLGKTGLNLNNGERLITSGGGEGRQLVAVKAATTAPKTVETKTGELDLGSLVSDLLVQLKTTLGKTKIKKREIQKFIEKIIIDCRFFTLLAVSGSLMGSILCYIEGSFIVAESYLQYFHSLSQRTNQTHTVELLIEALDMFLVGTALVVFGIGLFAMFVGSEKMKEKNRKWISRSNLFGLFYMKKIPTWVEMESMSAAKSKIGHAVMMILQVGVLEKFKNIPLSSAVDLACFAAAVLISSASIFFLSKLNVGEGGSGGFK